MLQSSGRLYFFTGSCVNLVDSNRWLVVENLKWFFSDFLFSVCIFVYRYISALFCFLVTPPTIISVGTLIVGATVNGSVYCKGCLCPLQGNYTGVSISPKALGLILCAHVHAIDQASF